MWIRPQKSNFSPWMNEVFDVKVNKNWNTPLKYKSKVSNLKFSSNGDNPNPKQTSKTENSTKFEKNLSNRNFFRFQIFPPKLIRNRFPHLEWMRFGMYPGPHQIIVRIGRMHFMKSMGMADLADQFSIGVHRFERQMVLLPRQHGLGWGQSIAIENHDWQFSAFAGGLVGHNGLVGGRRPVRRDLLFGRLVDLPFIIVVVHIVIGCLSWDAYLICICNFKSKRCVNIYWHA